MVEILVVILIITILIALIIPGLGMGRRLAARARCATNLKGLHTVFSFYGKDNDSWLPYNYRGDWEADPLWLTVAMRDLLGGEYGAAKPMWTCPAVSIWPSTDSYMPGWSQSPSITPPHSWSNPWRAMTGIYSVPTSYILYAGRYDGYRPPINGTANHPLTVDQQKRMLGGTTLTPWFTDVFMPNDSGNWTPSTVGDNPGHWWTGVNAALPHGAVIHKTYPGSKVFDANGDPQIVKFVDLTSMTFDINY